MTNHNISDLIGRIKALEEELEQQFSKRRNEFEFIIENKRIRFAEEIIVSHKRLKTGIMRYIFNAHPLNILTAPVIYADFIPFLLLDPIIRVCNP